MDAMMFLLGFLWVACGLHLAIEVTEMPKYDDRPPEHEFDYWTRMLGIVLLWPIFLVVSFVIIFFER